MRHQIFFVPFFIFLTFGLFINQSSNAQNKTWSGGGDGSTWTDPDNWSPVGVPVASDSVEIPSVSGGLTIIVNENIEIKYLKARFSNNTLEFENNAQMEVNDMVEHGTKLTGIGSVVVQDSLEWVFGDIDLEVIVLEGAIARIAGNSLTSSKWLRSNGRLVLNGTTTWEIADIIFSSDSEIVNNGFFEKNGSGRIRTTGTIVETPRFINNGTLKFSSGASLRAKLINSGETIIGSTVTLNSGSESDGEFIVEEGGLLNFNGGSHNLDDANFSGGGTVEFGSGSPVLKGTYNLDSNTGKTLFNGGVVTFSSEMNLISFGSELEIVGSGTTQQFIINRAPVITLPFLNKRSNTTISLGDGVEFVAERFDLFGGTVNGDGSISVINEMDWRAGIIRTDFVLEETANLLLSIEGLNTASTKTLGPDNTLTLLGNTEWEGGTFVMNPDAYIINHGTFVATGSLLNGFSAGGDIQVERRLENHGLFHLQSSASNLSLRRLSWLNFGVLRLEKQLNLVAGLGGFKTNVVNLDGGRIEGSGSVHVGGSVAGDLPATFDNFGTIAPGLPLGQFNWSGLYSSSAGAVLEIELGGTTAGEAHDLLSSSSRVELDGILDVKLANGFTPEVGQTFRIMEYTTASGDFRTIRAPAGFTFLKRFVNDPAENSGYIELEVMKAVDNPIETLQFVHPTVEHLGHSVAMGDFNGDGFDDLAVAGLKRLQAIKDINDPDFYTALAEDFITDLEVDTIFVLFNANSFANNQAVDLSVAADVKIATIPSSSVSFGGGNGMLHAADLNSDGQDELLVGGLVSETLVNAGGVYIFDFDGNTGFSGLSEASATALRSSDAGETYPERIIADDITNNGNPDIIVGFPEASVGGQKTGLVAIWEGFIDGFANDHLRLTTNEPGSRLGKWIDTGDVDGDGIVDLAVIAGGEIIEDPQFSRRFECVSRQDNPLDVDFYDRLVEESNPGKAFLKYGPFISGGNVLNDASDVIINGQFRRDFRNGFLSWRYAPFSRTLIDDFNGDGQASWFISEAMPRSTIVDFFIMIDLIVNKVCEGPGSPGINPGVQISWGGKNTSVARSAIHVFNADQLTRGTVLDEVDSEVSFSDAGRSMLGAKLRENSSRNDFVFSGDFGQTEVQLSDKDHTFNLFDFSDDDEEFEVARSYSFDFGLGTEDIRTDLAVSTPLSFERISGFGQSLAAGRMGNDDIDELIIGAPYYMPDNPGSTMGRVFLFRSDSQVSPPVSDLFDEFGGLGQWQFLSSYSEGQTYASFLSDVWTQGALNSSDPDGIPNIFTWNEQEAEFTAQFDLSEEIEVGVGFMAFLFEDDDPNTPEIDGGFPKTFNPGETSTSGNFEFGLSYTQNTASQLSGFNFISNPYNEPIDWDRADAWTKTNVSEALYVWDPSANNGNGAYLQRAGGIGDDINIIDPLQGFFTQATDSDAELIVTENAIMNEETSAEGNSDEMITMSMTLSSGDFEDQAFFLFRKDASDEIDPFDAFKLSPLSSNRMIFYSKSPEERPLAINNLPHTLSIEKTVPLIIESTFSGSFTSTWNLEHFPDDWDIELVDLSNDFRIDMRSENEYIFNFESNQQNKSTAKLADPIEFLSLPVQGNSPRLQLEITFGQAVSLEDQLEIPAEFSIDQNYPNPFNPTTTIRYGIPSQSNVQVELFNLLGQKVQVLVNETKQAGFHTVQLNASYLSSGIYIYRIQAGTFTETKKMMLIK